MTRVWIFVLSIISVSMAYGQEHRYMVFFADKPHAVEMLQNPSSILSESSLERRSNQDIALDESDVPVFEEYIDAVRATGANIFHSSKWFNGVLIQSSQEIADQVASLEVVTSVILVAPGERLIEKPEAYIAPDSLLPPANSFESDLPGDLIELDVMLEKGLTGEGITIAVLDAGFPGVDQSEVFGPLFKENRIIHVKDFVSNSGNPFQFSDHGTEVFSIMAVDYGQYQGTAPKANYLLYVTEDVQTETRIEEYNWLFAAEVADSAGADIIHSSLGYCDGFSLDSMNYEYEDLDGSTTVISRAAAIALAKGIFVVNSAGNEGNNSWQYITPPSDVDGVLSVGSVRSNLEIAGFSSIGPTSDGRIKPDVVAPGVGIPIVNGQGDFSTGNGTSYSAPVITGLVAGIWQENPGWKVNEVLSHILEISSQHENPDSFYGYGVPVYGGASQKFILANDIIQDRVTVYPNPFQSDWLFIKAGDLIGEKVEVVLFDIGGSRVASYRDTWEQTVLSWHLPGLENGIYLLRLRSGEFAKEVKLIKQ